MPADLYVDVKIRDYGQVRKMVKETKKAVGVLLKYELLDKQSGISIKERIEVKILEKVVVGAADNA